MREQLLHLPRREAVGKRTNTAADGDVVSAAVLRDERVAAPRARERAGSGGAARRGGAVLAAAVGARAEEEAERRGVRLHHEPGRMAFASHHPSDFPELGHDHCAVAPLAYAAGSLYSEKHHG